MTQLEQALLGLKGHDGVEHVLLVDTDGLLIQHIGEDDGPDRERVAAMVPGVVTAAGTFARAAGSERTSTAVLELDRGVAVVAPISPELLLAILIRPGVGFSALLRDLRRERGHLADLL